jgi:imidazolonepropionase-like amidohydrolase
MKTTRNIFLFALFALVVAAGFLAVPATHAQQQTVYAITGAKVFPISGPPMEGATVVIRDGKIAAVGKGAAIPSGAKVIDGKGLEVYPGMFNAVTEMGMNEIGEGVPGSVDTHELGDYNPQLVAATAVNPASEHIPVTRADGITHVIAAPGLGGGGGGFGGAGAVIPGQASLFNLAGWTMDQMQIKRSAAMVVNWPNLPNTAGSGRGGAGGGRGAAAAAAGGGAGREEYDKRIAELTNWLDAARHYDMAMQNKIGERDLKLEALVPVIKGDMPLFVVANQANQIREAVAYCDKQKVKMILATGTAAGEVKDLLKEKNVPVILRPTLTLVRGEDSPYDENLTLPGQLSAAGVKVAFGSYGNEFARRLSQWAGVAVAFGMSHDDAMKALTINPAEMFGVGKELGTIEPGKMANIIVTTGDPLELNTEVKYLFIKGQLTSTDNKHKELFEKYSKRP